MKNISIAIALATASPLLICQETQYLFNKQNHTNNPMSDFISIKNPQDFLAKIQDAFNSNNFINKKFFDNKDFSFLIGADKKEVFSWENDGTVFFRGKTFGWIENGALAGQSYTAQYYNKPNGKIKGQIFIIFNPQTGPSFDTFIKTFGPYWKHGPRTPSSLEAIIKPARTPEGNENIIYEIKVNGIEKIISATLDENANISIIFISEENI